MSENKYWQGFGEFSGKEEYEQRIQNEFQEELPFEEKNDKGWLDAATPRRDFLKYLGFSTAAASLAAGCKVPVKQAIPFGNKPAEMVPGVAKYYATTYVQDGDVVPIVAKVRDGRPIKIEGNTLSSFTKGGTSARAQASVLDLYDTNRLTHPKRKVGDKFEEIPTFEQLDQMIIAAMSGVKNPVLLTSTITSPSTKDIIAKYPGLKHVQYDADSFTGILLANEVCFGKKAIPSYNFSNAKVIVSFGADFLGTWLSPVEFSRQYVQNRKLKDASFEMSKHYQFESFLSTTGASADVRLTHRPSETGAVALALYAALGGNSTAPSIDKKLQTAIDKIASELKANSKNTLVVSGSNDKNIQTVVNGINSLLGSYGTTIDWSTTLNCRQGIDADMNKLLADMESGEVDAVMIYGANPAYDYHAADKFSAAIKKTKIAISFSEKLDETSELCTYLVPAHHYLESWGDAEPKSNHICFIQPTIHPLFKTRPFQTSLLKWSGSEKDYETYFKEYWISKIGSSIAFDAALQNGVLEKATTNSTTKAFNSNSITSAATSISNSKPNGNIELVLYQKVSIGTGKQAGNPWLQELPDPITKATWDNYALMSMSMAKELLGVNLANGTEKEINKYEYFPEKPVVKITSGNKEIELPVLILPGMNAHTIAVAVGYGRTKSLGKVVEGVGKNASIFSSFNGTSTDYFSKNVSISNTGKKYKIAQTQIHNSYEDRTEVVKETSLANFKSDPNQFKKYRDDLAKNYAPLTGDYSKEGTLYPSHEQPGLKWGMSVDMNSCVACGACVIACHAENNVPVVGKSEVVRYHDMHWLRIDRYFVSDKENADDLKSVVFQPMMCQHCDNAPCENVCPVAATTHSTEGINQMAYNRCIGTRYCANNCPYKVRRFNWADYTGSDSFPNNQDQKLVGVLDPVVNQMNEDLTRMVLNPDVTVRSRGVIEKCSFCIQRVQEGKLTAKKEGRVLADGDAKTACMTACPTEAIVFGNVHDKESRITKTREENQQRLFYVIEQVHTLPNVNYLAKIRNTDELPEVEHHEEATH